ncbi:MAG: hypothetical protein ABJE66_08475 [Deltaproteobacteria bacterium]
MNKLLLIFSSVLPLALANPAHADRDCGRKGAMLISEVHTSNGIDVGSSGFEVTESGSWHVYHHDPKAMDTLDATGCLTEAELTSLKQALANAPWKTTHNAITCDALALGHTEWSAGKHTYADVLCGSESIDSTTQKLFGLVQKLETKYTPKPATRAK